jgi:hypothetical protein
VAKNPRAYRGEKRSKELARLKKQEEKRLRRQGKSVGERPESEEQETAEKEAEPEA